MLLRDVATHRPKRVSQRLGLTRLLLRLLGACPCRWLPRREPHTRASREDPPIMPILVVATAALAADLITDNPKSKKKWYLKTN